MSIPRGTWVLLAFVAPPALELALLRAIAHATLGPQNVVLGSYGRDVFVPLFIAAGLVALFLERAVDVELRFRPWWAVLNGAALALAAAALSPLGLAVSPDFRVAAFFAAGAAALLSGPFLFLGLFPVRRLIALYPERLLFLVGSAWLFVLYTTFLKDLWPWLSAATAHAVYHSLRALGVEFHALRVSSSVIIRHRELTASINMGCSGLEGIAFFLFSFAVFRLYDWELYRGWRSVLLCVLGVTVMFVANCVRISLFLVASIWLIRHVAAESGRQFLTWAFHENIGWLLYAAVIAGFYWVVYRGRRVAVAPLLVLVLALAGGAVFSPTDARAAACGEACTDDSDCAVNGVLSCFRCVDSTCQDCCTFAPPFCPSACVDVGTECDNQDGVACNQAPAPEVPSGARWPLFFAIPVVLWALRRQRNIWKR